MFKKPDEYKYKHEVWMKGFKKEDNKARLRQRYHEKPEEREKIKLWNKNYEIKTVF